MATRRVSGTIRKLSSGRYQARLRRGETGRQETVGTYRSKADADAALRAAEAAQAAGRWVDPARGRITLRQYADSWLVERARLAPRTREIYAGLLRVHILPALGDVRLDRLTPSEVRRWHREGSEGSSPSMAPKAYRLLRTILSTAVDDEVLARNPCRIRSAGVDRSSPQQIVSIPQLYAIADAIARRYRALVLLAGLAGLRAGELSALCRADIDLERGTVDVNKQRVRLDSGKILVAPPKTDAGRRIVALPQVLVPELEAHLASFVGPATTDLVFTGERGAPLDRTNFRDRFWKPATVGAGVPGLRVHDLRHTAATLAATTGASTKELMARLGHASPRAALIYQHATRDRDVGIAEALSDLVDRARQPDRAG